MTDLNRRLPRVDSSRFSMVPRADIPRSTFVTTHSVKATFNAGDLVPIHVDEVLPGDVHQGQLTIFARLNNLLFPLMDNMELETFFFFAPSRILWTNWKKMMGERTNPSDSISYTVPYVDSAASGWAVGSLGDYLGLPTVGQVTGGGLVRANALPFRAYNLIYNEWFRDQNLQNALTISTGDGPDNATDYTLKKRNKKHDYFTSCLPWPLKGGTEVTMPLSGTAPVLGIATSTSNTPNAGNPANYLESNNVSVSGWVSYFRGNTAGDVVIEGTNTAAGYAPAVFADLSQATGATINALRLAVATQRLLERDARSGTRYTELLRAHFGVIPEDARLQRPEYIGGGRTNFQTQAIPQTSATGLTGGTTPAGALTGQSLVSDQHSFTYNATEHGYILGLVNVRGELTYQQGIHRLWTRSTRYDFYWPAFAHLGEQVVQQREIYYEHKDTGTTAFGYQERWAEYRHRPSRLTGLFRSTSSGNIDEWHLAEQFGSLPALNSTFIEDPSKATLQRALAAGAGANNFQILFDSVFKIKNTRPMPMFSVPGMMDRF